jgi:hypothetical protein
MPPEFPALAATESSADLCVKFNTGPTQIARWRRDCRVPPHGRGVFKPLPMPDNFADLARTMTRREAGSFWQRHPETLDRWAAEKGITFRKQVNVISGRRATKVRDTARDMSRAGQAAEFLQKFGPVFRCNGTGQPDAKGEHWRRGSSVLSHEEIIARAERNGWQRDAWKRITISGGEGARA